MEQALFAVVNQATGAREKYPTTWMFREGERAVLSVSAAGPAPLGYQWLKNGVNVPGATNSIYTIEQAARTDRGDYAVIVSTGSLSVSSPTVKLTVIGLSILNGGFELGNFSGWITNDVSQPYIPLAVRRNGFNLGNFGFPNLVTRQIEGSFSAAFGFHGSSSGGRNRSMYERALAHGLPFEKSRLAGNARSITSAGQAVTSDCTDPGICSV